MSGCRWFILAAVLFSGVMLMKHADAATPDTGFLPLQSIVVTTESWDDRRASLQRFARNDPSSSWKPVGKKMKAVVGRNGLGWGRGLHTPAPGDGPVKREGDGRAPAGIFRLGRAFGYAAAERVSWIRISYRQSLAGDRCVDDPASPLYNRIVDTAEIRRSWKSDEEMLRKDDQYRLGIFIGHNTDPVSAGSGSCIFLHIWKKEGAGTAGCTAVSKEDIVELLRWLDPTASPVLIQMPRREYERLRKDRQLP